MAGSGELHGATITSSSTRDLPEDQSSSPLAHLLVSDPRATVRVGPQQDALRRRGSPQQLLLQFQRQVNVFSVSIMFQGGFVGQDVVVHAKSSATERWEQLGSEGNIEPEDANDLQVFSCEALAINALRISFNRSTDFYGRVIIYRLDVVGVEHTVNY